MKKMSLKSPKTSPWFHSLSIFLTAVLLLTAATALGQERCEQVFTAVQLAKATTAAHETVAAPAKLPQITYGLEVEYDIQASKKILEDYRPVGVSWEKWKDASFSERETLYRKKLGLVTYAIRKLFGRAKMIKNPGAPESLPATLDVESHGTAEVNGFIFKNMDDLKSTIAIFEERYGQGYYQSHVVFDKALKIRFASYTVFDFEYYQLENLSSSFDRYAQGSQKGSAKSLPAANFLHYALSPFSAKTSQKLVDAENTALAGEKLGKGGHGRLVFGTSPRDDIYPDGKVGVELRNHNRRSEDLVEATEAWKAIIEGNLSSRFDIFSKAPQVSAETLQQSDLPAVQSRLQEWTGIFAKLGAATRKNSNFKQFHGAVPYEQRFLYPLRNWNKHPLLDLIRNPELRHLYTELIETAQNNYLEMLYSATKEAPNDDWLLAKARMGAGRFAYETSLQVLMNDFYTQVVTDKKPDSEIDLSKVAEKLLNEYNDRSLRADAIDYERLMQGGKQAGTSMRTFRQASLWDGEKITGIMIGDRELGTSAMPQKSAKAYLLQQGNNRKLPMHASMRLDLAEPLAVTNDKGEIRTITSLILDIGALQSVNHGSGDAGSKQVETKVYRLFDREVFEGKVDKTALRYYPLELKQDELENLLPVFLEQAGLQSNKVVFDFKGNNCAVSTFEVISKSLNSSIRKTLTKILEGSFLVRSGRSMPQLLNQLGLLNNTPEVPQ